MFTPLMPALRKRKPRTPKPPKDSKTYKAVMAYVALRAQGLKRAAIAEQLGLQPDTLTTYMKYAHKRGWLNYGTLVGTDDKLEIDLSEKALRNISQVLDERTDTGALSGRASEVALEVAKGLGHLKQHQVVKSDGATTMGVALKVSVEMPPMQGAVQQIRAGSIGGQPAFDAEIMESEG